MHRAFFYCYTVVLLAPNNVTVSILLSEASQPSTMTELF